MSTIDPVIGTSVGPYQIVQRLGAGGMGEVFLAEDTRLRRRVALKRLTDDSLGDAEKRARVLREARAVARLHHPGIASIFDVVEDGNTVAIVMEFVEGQTLSARLREGRLSLAEAVRIGVELTSALAHAHANGVLHCDLKPSNVILTPAGEAKILDFGLSHRSADAVASDDTRVLSIDVSRRDAGKVSGSPGYMAPERLSGQPPDERSDVFSLGVVLFELLTGRRPFAGSDIVALAVAALTGPAPRPSLINPHIPEALSAVVTKAIAAAPDARFQSIADLGAALRAVEHDAAPANSTPPLPEAGAPPARGRFGGRRYVVTAAGAALIVIAGLWLSALGPAWLGSSLAVPESGTAAIVVKPFANLSGDSANDHFGVGIADELTTKLSTLPHVTVMSRSTTADYLAQHPGSRTLARDLGANYIIEGGVGRSGDQLQVSVSLVRPDGSVAWASRYAGTLPGLFALQNDVAEGLAGHLNVTLTPTVRRSLEGKPTDNVEAFADYSQGRLFLERRDAKGNIDHAIESFERAISKDAKFAIAHAALGSAYWAKYLETQDAAWTARAIDTSLEALRLDQSRAEVHLALAEIYKGLGRAPAAMDALQRALALQPNSDDAHRALGDILSSDGRTDEAIREHGQAIAIRPNYWQNHNRLAVALSSAGRFTAAAASFQRVTELQPDSALGFGNLGAVLMMAGDLPRALTNLERAVAIAPRASIYSNIGTIHYWNGRFADARQAYQRAIALRPDDTVFHRNLGDALWQLKDTSAARSEYDRATELVTNQLKVNPKDADAVSLMAVLQAKLDRPAEARGHVTRAIELAPKNANVQYRSAVVAALAGESALALAALERAVALGYSTNMAGRDLDLVALRGRPEYSKIMNTRKLGS